MSCQCHRAASENVRSPWASVLTACADSVLLGSRWAGVRERLFLQRAQAEVQLCHWEGGSLHQQLSGAPPGRER